MDIDESPIVKITNNLPGKSADVHLDQLSPDQKKELFVECARYGLSFY